MNVKYPAEAVALGIILFSAGMKESLAAGSLIILTLVFGEFLKNLLEPLIPEWSLKPCVFLASAALCAGIFLLGFSYLGMRVDTGTGILVFLLGFLIARHVLRADLQAEYGEIFWQWGVIWGFWILLATVREFLATGSVFGNLIWQGEFQSKGFLELTFGFLGAGLVLAFANGVLGKKITGTESFFLAVPLVIFSRPFEMDSFGPVIGQIWTILVPLVLFVSLRKTLKFSRSSRAYRGLPTEMLALGFIYMILSIY